VFRVTDLKTVCVATPDFAGATSTFRENFALRATRRVEDGAAGTQSAFLAIGDAEIEMSSPTAESSAVAAFLSERGAGLFRLTLEVDDLDAARAEIAAKGVAVTIEPGPDGRPIARLEPSQTHGVRLALVGRRSPSR
jgi:methylmalonyl-CoA epimerase